MWASSFCKKLGLWRSLWKSPLESQNGSSLVLSAFSTSMSWTGWDVSHMCHKTQRSKISYLPVWPLLSRDPYMEPGRLARDTVALREGVGAATAPGDGPSPFLSTLLRYASQGGWRWLHLTKFRDPFWKLCWRLTCHWAGKEMCLHLKLIT